MGLDLSIDKQVKFKSFGRFFLPHPCTSDHQIGLSGILPSLRLGVTTFSSWALWVALLLWETSWAWISSAHQQLPALADPARLLRGLSPGKPENPEILTPTKIH